MVPMLQTSQRVLARSRLHVEILRSQRSRRSWVDEVWPTEKQCDKWWGSLQESMNEANCRDPERRALGHNIGMAQNIRRDEVEDRAWLQGLLLLSPPEGQEPKQVQNHKGRAFDSRAIYVQHKLRSRKTARAWLMRLFDDHPFRNLHCASSLP